MQKKHWILFFACLMATALSAMGLFSRQCAYIRDNTLRLHILANSDSPEDQAIKLQVRDAVLAATDRLFAACQSRQEVLEAAQNHLPYIRDVAADTLQKLGADPSVQAQVTSMHFDSRVYGDHLLPAGRYTAVRITLGNGDGKNWWCVLYPPLCLQSAAKPDEAAQLVEEALLLAQDLPRYQVRLALTEWLQTLRQRQLEWKKGGVS